MKYLMSIEEVQDVFAEFENRLSYLENSNCNLVSKEEPQFKKEDNPWTDNQWDTIKQIKAMVLFLQGKIDKHIEGEVDKKNYAPF